MLAPGKRLRVNSHEMRIKSGRGNVGNLLSDLAKQNVQRNLLHFVALCTYCNLQNIALFSSSISETGSWPQLEQSTLPLPVLLRLDYAKVRAVRATCFREAGGTACLDEAARQLAGASSGAQALTPALAAAAAAAVAAHSGA